MIVRAHGLAGCWRRQSAAPDDFNCNSSGTADASLRRAPTFTPQQLLDAGPRLGLFIAELGQRRPHDQGDDLLFVRGQILAPPARGRGPKEVLTADRVHGA